MSTAITSHRQQLTAMFVMAASRSLLSEGLMASSLAASILGSCPPLLLGTAVAAGSYGLATLIDKTEQYVKTGSVSLSFSSKRPLVQINHIHVDVKVEARNISQLYVNPQEVVNRFLPKL